MSDAQQADLIVIGQDIFDAGRCRWLASLKAWRPIWLHQRDGLVWLVGDDSVMRALDAATGEERWGAPLPGPLNLVAVGLDDLLVATREELWVVDLDSGRWRELVWYEEIEIEHLAHLGQHAVLGLTDNRIVIVNLLTGEETASVEPLPVDDPDVAPHQRPIGRGRVSAESTALVPTRRMAFCAVTELERHYDLRCFDPWGSLVWRGAIEHTSLSWLDGVAEILDKRIVFRAAGRRWLLFTPCGPGDESVLVRLASGDRTVLDRDVAAVVEDGEGHVRGLLVVEPDDERVLLCDPDTGEVRWSLSFEFAPCNLAAASLGPHGLVIAIFHAFQRDVVVSCVELGSGLVRWRERLEVPAVPYRLRHEFNAVDIVQLPDAIVVRMQQAPRAYVRVLDPHDGRCRFPAPDARHELM